MRFVSKKPFDRKKQNNNKKYFLKFIDTKLFTKETECKIKKEI